MEHCSGQANVPSLWLMVGTPAQGPDSPESLHSCHSLAGPLVGHDPAKLWSNTAPKVTLECSGALSQPLSGPTCSRGQGEIGASAKPQEISPAPREMLASETHVWPPAPCAWPPAAPGAQQDCAPAPPLPSDYFRPSTSPLMSVSGDERCGTRTLGLDLLPSPFLLQ